MIDYYRGKHRKEMLRTLVEEGERLLELCTILLGTYVYCSQGVFFFA